MSDYMDNLKVKAGDYVRCKANIGCPSFTVGRFYKVLPKKLLQNDQGQVVLSSARFEPMPVSIINAFK